MSEAQTDVKKYKVSGRILGAVGCLIGPIILLAVVVTLYAITNFFFISLQSDVGADAGAAPDIRNTIGSLIQIVLGLVGVIGVVGIMFGIPIGLALLFTSGESKSENKTN